MTGLASRVARRARYECARAVGAARAARRHREIARGVARDRHEPRVFYGVDRLPGVDEVAFGGIVKFQLLARTFPNEPRGFNLLYLGSSSRPPDAEALVRLARRRDAPFLWNQNGVAYPGWFGAGYDAYNRVPARLHREADHVVYQTEFCRLAAERFYGDRAASSEILPNPVDLERFTPPPTVPDRPPTLLLGGNQYQRYRLEAALRTVALLPDVRLLVTGAISWSAEAPREAAALVRELGLDDRVELAGTYTQAEAPDVLQRADALLHTKVNDPCPTVVLEAMACGLPVVYSATGGTPELVGADAGVGVPGQLDWLQDRPPLPEELAAAVRDVLARLPELRVAARRRAELFGAERYVERHRELFELLLSSDGPGRASRYPDAS